MDAAGTDGEKEGGGPGAAAGAPKGLDGSTSLARVLPASVAAG